VNPQQGYVIQNVPVPPQAGCCGGPSEKFQHKVGMTTGSLQIILAVVSAVVSGVNTYMYAYELPYPGQGGGIGGAIFLFLPAGILGVCSKNKSSCVVVAYLVMSILSAIHAFGLACVEGLAAAFFSTKTCNDAFYPIDYPVDYMEESIADEFLRPIMSSMCLPERMTCVFAMHIVVCVAAVIEFVVAIVASAICCGGLRCCCSQNQPTQQRTVTMMQYQPTMGQMQAAQPLSGGQPMQGTGPMLTKA